MMGNQLLNPVNQGILNQFRTNFVVVDKWVAILVDEIQGQL